MKERSIPMTQIDWRDYIYCDSKILRGKPVIKGTRLSVEFLLGLLAQGWSEEQILENYPTLTKESLRAVFVFVQEHMKDELMYSISAEVIS